METVTNHRRMDIPSIGKRTGRAFSLVELVIVMTIIGILAAIAIPRISGGASRSGEAALAGNLANLRSAIELYAAEHNSYYPGALGDGTNGAGSPLAFVNQLTQYSNEKGEVSATRDTGHPFGPYLYKGMPPLPVGANKGGTGVFVDDREDIPEVNSGNAAGWIYNPLTGAIIANSDESDSTGTRTYDQY